MEKYEVGADKVYRVYEIVSDNSRIDKVDDIFIKKIADKTGFSRNTVWRALKFLEDIDVIEKKRNGRRKNLILS